MLVLLTCLVASLADVVDYCNVVIVVAAVKAADVVVYNLTIIVHASLTMKYVFYVVDIVVIVVTTVDNVVVRSFLFLFCACYGGRIPELYTLFIKIVDLTLLLLQYFMMF